MLPSSPVSVGTFPSNRTLPVGMVQFCLLMKLEHLPVFDDPFTATKFVSLGMKYFSGRTGIIILSHTLMNTLLNTVLPCELVSGKN